MSNRERWVVYPLLFFTLVLVLIDKLIETGTAEFRSVLCHELHVIDRDGVPLVSLSGNPDDTSGTIAIYQPVGIGGANGNGSDDAGLRGHLPNRRVELGSDEGDGYVNVYGPGQVPILRLGHDGQLRASGLVATDTQGTLLGIDGLPEGSFWGNTVAWDSVAVQSNYGSTTPESSDASSDGEDPQKGEPAGDDSALIADDVDAATAGVED